MCPLTAKGIPMNFPFVHSKKSRIQSPLPPLSKSPPSYLTPLARHLDIAVERKDWKEFKTVIYLENMKKKCKILFSAMKSIK